MKLKYINGFIGNFNYTFKVQKNKKMRYLVIYDGMFPVCIVMPAAIVDTGFDTRISEMSMIVEMSMKNAVASIAGESVPERTMIGTWQNFETDIEQMEL